ncbi:energy transducer TonB [Maricaulis sp.]|uniref:energy transducer TonB n=1 Tax=Maricaulis sp. TaxID=1486257 RepID=UPI003296ABA6
MQLKLAVLAAAACLWSVAEGASAQDLPSTVTTPYLEYQRALEDGDGAAALDAARRALEAGETEGIDRETLGLLAENYGESAAEQDDFERAFQIWRQAARLGDQAGIAPVDQAWREFNAAQAAYHGGQIRDAARFAYNALRNLERAREADGASPVFFGGVAALAARLSAERGRWEEAREKADIALQAFYEGRRMPDADFALAHYIAGLSRQVAREPVEAVYHHMMAQFMLSEIPDGERRDWMMSALGQNGWFSSENQREAAIERIGSDPYYLARYAGQGNPSEPQQPPGFTDASVLERHEPRYPVRAVERGQRGFSAVAFDIDENGNIVDPRVIEDLPAGAFGDAALRVLDDWRFEPAMQDGEPVRRENYVVSFSFWLG